MTAPQRPRAREDLTVVELDDEAVIYDEGTGDLHHLNPTATVVFSLCDGSATATELAAELAAAFGQPVGEMERQVRALLRSFKTATLIEASGVGPRG